VFAGGVPVPLYPPAPGSRTGEELERLVTVLRNAGTCVAVTVPEAMHAARLLRLEVPTLRRVHTMSNLLGPHPDAPLPQASSEDLALIQYTSGSTGDPKGVVLTHGQLIANVRAMGRAADVTAEDIVVSWLPLYHDMGLIGMWLAPLVLGLPLVVMSPLTFLARPAAWLEALTSYGGTISAAPNFAFQACVDRVTEPERAALDLSSWRLAFNGSERVTQATVDAFVQRFAGVGFRRDAMCPAYGLAEAGVGISFSPPGRGRCAGSTGRPCSTVSGRLWLSTPRLRGSDHGSRWP
jgi:acyl-CoA synthetase (AMP-forming)/AMP-acid ligase II